MALTENFVMFVREKTRSLLFVCKCVKKLLCFVNELGRHI